MGREGLSLLLGLLLSLGCLRPPSAAPAAEPPPAPREFRGVWVATVANIDWPSAKGLAPEAQRAEALAIIERARDLGLNAILLQVRPAADALYASQLEPWSEVLGGVQGQAPAPFYDPLAFWVEEAHRAGLELHAWFNPYRAGHASSTSAPAPSHVRVARPGLVRTYGDQVWLDPAEPAAAAHSLAVILDVVRRYDVDGVHLDDYFYPYPVKDAAGVPVSFPDEGPWQAYLATGGGLARADWRRAQVDRFIASLYREVHAAKAHVRVGISPFGLGRPDRRAPMVTGFSQYDQLYANVELWLECGWLDYLAPQLYWRRASPGQPFLPLLDTWREGNPLDRPVWPGLFTSQTLAAVPWPAEEIIGQIEAARSREGSRGHLHFSMAALRRNAEGVADLLRTAYDGAALVPAAPWLGADVPPLPRLRLRREAGMLRLEAEGTAARLAVWARFGPTWRFLVLPGPGGDLPAAHGGQPLVEVVASALSRTGLEGARQRVGVEPE